MKAISKNKDYQYRVEVCFMPLQYPLYEQDMGIVVVIDVLRATSAMVVAFERGVDAIIPVASVEEARAYIGKPGYVAAAERNGEVVKGFDFGNSPLAFQQMDLTGKKVVLTTTNGTQAINVAQHAKRLVIGSFLNITALSQWLVEQDENILLLCSGWQNKFNLEDSIFAGAVMDRLLKSKKFGAEEDSSIAAQYLFRTAKENMMRITRAAPRRRRLEQLELVDDVKFCLTPDQSTIIPELRDGMLVRMEIPEVAKRTAGIVQ